MSDETNSISTVHNEDDEKGGPLSFKISYTQEIFQGSELKSRFELSKSAKYHRIKRRTIRDEGPYNLKKDSGKTPKTSEESTNKKDINMEESDYCTKSPSQEKNYCRSLMKISATILISIILGRYIILSNIFYNESIAIDRVATALYGNILNQNSSIATFMDSLRDLHQSSTKKILTCLVGPTGVGKTHFINILGNHLNSSNLEVFHRKDLPNLCDRDSYITRRIRRKLYFSEFSIIVLDDLKFDDIQILQKFIEQTFSIEDTSILILTVFNIETNNCLEHKTEITISPDLIKGKVKSLGDNFYFSNFNYLDKSAVQLWLQKLLITRNVPLQFHSEIIDRLLKSHDIRCHGLKGLHPKLLLELYESFN